MSYTSEFNKLGGSVLALAGAVKDVQKGEEKAKEEQENLKLDVEDTGIEIENQNLEIGNIQKQLDDLTIDKQGKLRNSKGQFFSQKAFIAMNDEIETRTKIRDRLQKKFDILTNKVEGGNK